MWGDRRPLNEILCCGKTQTHFPRLYCWAFQTVPEFQMCHTFPWEKKHFKYDIKITIIIIIKVIIKIMVWWHNSPLPKTLWQSYFKNIFKKKNAQSKFTNKRAHLCLRGKKKKKSLQNWNLNFVNHFSWFIMSPRYPTMPRYVLMKINVFFS